MFTMDVKQQYIIKNPNLTKKFWRLGGGRGVARVSDFFLFSKESKCGKNVFFLRE